MTRKRVAIISAGAVLVVGAAAGASAASFGGGGGDDAEAPITGDALVRASEVALDHTKGGQVTETEVGDEESYYEVEVTLDDGTEVDVQLDENFNVVGSEPDGPDGPNDN